MKIWIGILALQVVMSSAFAQDDAFTPGPVFEEYGPVADVDADFEIPKGMSFKVSYDVREGGESGARNRRLETAARFINMHARAGVPEKNMKLALVIHGKAVHDVSGAAHYAEAVGGENANAPMLAALMEHGVRVIVCGQSATHYYVTNEDLLPGVEMAISAMTAHAVLQQEGYTLNPF
ncbi:DsrE family protein [Marinicaulis aureus]|uniref:DsrE family protein n=1 Tax=Hyphococcus aureus TaxID=2666033 RepID=A0ABW1KXQ1_9PROT